MKILGATVLIKCSGTDSINLITDLPCGVYPYEGNQFVKLEVAKGMALDYIHRNFVKTGTLDISSITVIDISTGKKYDLNMKEL